LKCGTCGLSGDGAPRLLAVGDFEGRARVWDLERMAKGALCSGRDQQPLFVTPTPQEGPQQIVNCIAALPHHFLLTGARDGRARLWDIRTAGGAAVAQVSFPESDCWAVTFGSSGADGPDHTASFIHGQLSTH